jgi:hypothetical protein
MSFLKMCLVKTMFYLEDYCTHFFQSWMKFHAKDKKVILLSNVFFENHSTNRHNFFKGLNETLSYLLFFFDVSNIRLMNKIFSGMAVNSVKFGAR